MIKFFRHIRKSLLEQNQIGKYFKYAFGEILLVVIGILIALQINNWNENRKELALLRGYYKQLIEELEADISVINFSIKRLEQDIKNYKLITKSLTTHNLPINDIVTIFKKSSFLIDNTSFNTKTIEVLKTTGDIKLLSPNIKNALIALENEQQDHERDRITRSDFYLSNLRGIIYLSPYTNKKYWENHKIVSNKVNIKDKIIEELPLIDNALSSKYLSNKYDMLELQTILEQTKELKRFIQKEL